MPEAYIGYDSKNDIAYLKIIGICESQVIEAVKKRELSDDVHVSSPSSGKYILAYADHPGHGKTWEDFEHISCQWLYGLAYECGIENVIDCTFSEEKKEMVMRI